MECIDARGQACPLPVVRAKKALSSINDGLLEVLVDNDTSVRNLEALARALGCAFASKKLEEGQYSVVFNKGEAEGQEKSSSLATNEVQSAEKITDESHDTIVVISSEYMGSGDDELGSLLMKSFLFACTQLDVLPKSMLLYNGAVKLACEGSGALEDLETLAQEGVGILSCGTCLNHFGLENRLCVGEITNMYDIVEKQMSAKNIIQP